MLGGTFLIRACGFCYPFLTYYLAELHLSAHLIGWALAAFGGGWLGGQLAGGWLADHIGRRATLVGTMLTAAAVLPLLATAGSVPAILAATIVSGACYDAPRPVVSATCADLIPDEAGRATFAGWRHLAVNLGAALTGAVGGMLAGPLGIRALIWINAAACAAFAGIVLRYMEADRPAAPGADIGWYRIALRDVRLWLLCLASLSALTCAVSLFSALPMLMTARHLSAAAYGWTQAANALVVVLLSPFLTPLLGRRAATRPLLSVFALGSLVLGGGMSAAGLASTTSGFTVAVALAVPGELLVFIAASDLLNRIAPSEARGLYAGIWGTTLAGAVIVAPLLAAWSLAHGGAHLVGATTLCAGLLGAALCLPLKAVTRNAPRTAGPAQTRAPRRRASTAKESHALDTRSPRTRRAGRR